MTDPKPKRKNRPVSRLQLLIPVIAFMLAVAMGRYFGTLDDTIRFDSVSYTPTIILPLILFSKPIVTAMSIGLVIFASYRLYLLYPSLLTNLFSSVLFLGFTVFLIANLWLFSFRATVTDTLQYQDISYQAIEWYDPIDTDTYSCAWGCYHTSFYQCDSAGIICEALDYQLNYVEPDSGIERTERAILFTIDNEVIHEIPLASE